MAVSSGERQDDGKYVWIKTDAVMDSGSVEVLGPPGLVDKDKVRETELSRNGLGYNAANGGKIRNLGEGPVVAKSETGMNLDFTAQLGDKISRLLIGLSRAADAGNAILFNVDQELIQKLAKSGNLKENMIVDKKTMAQGEIKRKDGIYVYPMWIRREKASVQNKIQYCEGISGSKHFTADMIEGQGVQDPWEDLF